jgi:hypothetical protein
MVFLPHPMLLSHCDRSAEPVQAPFDETVLLQFHQSVTLGKERLDSLSGPSPLGLQRTGEQDSKQVSPMWLSGTEAVPTPFQQQQQQQVYSYPKAPFFGEGPKRAPAWQAAQSIAPSRTKVIIMPEQETKPDSQQTLHAGGQKDVLEEMDAKGNHSDADAAVREIAKGTAEALRSVVAPQQQLNSENFTSEESDSISATTKRKAAMVKEKFDRQKAEAAKKIADESAAKAAKLLDSASAAAKQAARWTAAADAERLIINRAKLAEKAATQQDAAEQKASIAQRAVADQAAKKESAATELLTAERNAADMENAAGVAL